jgi:hypothetical protein
MIITTFNLSNGEILKTVDCPASDLVLQYNSSTEDYIEGMHPGNKYYIDNKTPVLIPDAPNDYSKFDFDTKQWVKRQTDDQRWVLVKSNRVKKLEASDWTDTVSAPARLGTALYQSWQNYRQALRDITTQADPFNIVWPTPPQ